MKKYIEYKLLLRLEVAEIGERDGWPVKGLVVSDDGENWHDAGCIKAIGKDCETCKHELWNYCAQPIERIEWEIGDTVQIGYLKGWIESLSHPYARVINADHYPDIHSIAIPKADLKPWTPSYGYTEKGELIEPPEGYKIVPEGEELPENHIAYYEKGWCPTDIYTGYSAKIRKPIRAYARKIEPERKTAKEWFLETLPIQVADKAIYNTTSDALMERYESTIDALSFSFYWSDTPEREDYWSKWFKWLHGNLQEMPPIEPFDDSNVEKYTQFYYELKDLLNRHGMENNSDTSDRILADYLTNCLKSFDTAIQLRKEISNKQNKQTSK
mgnify:CR=1 FL=1